VNDLAIADQSDVQAIADYWAGAMGKPSPERQQQAKALLVKVPDKAEPARPSAGEELGGAIFAGACANCHLGNAAIVPPRGIDLSLSAVLSQDDPRDAIRIVVDGISPSEEEAGPRVGRHPGSDIRVGRCGVAIEQRPRAHDHPGGAIAALRSLLFNKRLLQLYLETI
jgi:mono/diheme cytochrome c family protein